MIRGDLLKRYPNTIIYAQQATLGRRPAAQEPAGAHRRDRRAVREEPEGSPAALSALPRVRRARHLFHRLRSDARRGQGRPDARGDRRGARQAGAGAARLVLRAAGSGRRAALRPRRRTCRSSRPPTPSWNDLSWANVDLDRRPAHRPVEESRWRTSDAPREDGTTWGANAADMAYILYQEPVMVGIHGREMLKNLVRRPERMPTHLTSSPRCAATAIARWRPAIAPTAARPRARRRACGTPSAARPAANRGRPRLRSEACVDPHGRRRRARERHRGLSDSAVAGLREWLRQTPEDVVERLPRSAIHSCCFPVRLETRFARTPNGAAELRVRIWPDDIGIALPPGDLTAERARRRRAVLERARDRGDDAGPGGAADARAPGLRRRVERHRHRYGAYRAGWIVAQTKPSNWNDVTKAPAALPLVFPSPCRRPSRVSRAPTCCRIAS